MTMDIEDGQKHHFRTIQAKANFLKVNLNIIQNQEYGILKKLILLATM